MRVTIRAHRGALTGCPSFRLCGWKRAAGYPQHDCTSGERARRHEFLDLALAPLSAADAGLLLDRQPRPPRGRARTQVLAQAAGNPMALIELATVIADDPAAS